MAERAMTAAESIAVRHSVRDKALRWRADHVDVADRDGLWRSYVTGQTWRVRGATRLAAIRAALDDAERVTPFGSREEDERPCS